MSSVAIIGGLGHVGLPLGLFLADHGHEVRLVDPNPVARAAVEAGRMPFMEEGAEELLKKHYGETLHCGDLYSVRTANVVIVCIGTPLDEYQNPRLEPVLRLAENELKHLLPDQLVILRSTVFPGTTSRLAEVLDHGVAFAPERIVQGRALKELAELPQVVSGTNPETALQAREFFEELGVSVIETSPLEAEYTKLFANAFRYVTISLGNEFYRIATDAGADYQRVYRALTEDYPRCQIPKPGFCAGSCLVNSTSQLIAATPHGFPLGQAARYANEFLPNWLIRRLDGEGVDAISGVWGILGMSFKPENDDPRDSLSFKIKKLLEFKGATVLCSDEYMKAPWLLPKEEVLERASVTIIATPHAAYRDLKALPNRGLVRIWEDQ